VISRDDGRCRERNKTEACCIASCISHEIHVSLDSQGYVIARWRMVAEDLLVEDAVPRKTNPKYL
jgi:hypothetical protein